MAEIIKLDVKNFVFKNDSKKTPQTGVIAQQLQKVFPNSVIEDEEGYLHIKLDEMFYAAINALKELDKKLITLVRKATKIETKISKLEKENIILKTQVEDLAQRVSKIKAQRGL